MTRGELASALAAAGIPDAREEAMRLFCHFAGVSRAHALAEPAEDCREPGLRAALTRRLSREPLAYILGRAFFYDEEYEVSPACLIPRPESELLVEYAREHLPVGGRFADFCTGSGCLAVSLLACRPDLQGDAYDIAEEALALAARNAARSGVAQRLILRRCDLLFPGGVCYEEENFPHAPYDMILSNPPYVTAEEMRELPPEVTREPALALFGGEDGLAFYRAFLEHAVPLLAPRGCFLFEIGWQQGEALSRLAAAHGLLCEVRRDYGGRDRVAILHQ